MRRTHAGEAQSRFSTMYSDQLGQQTRETAHSRATSLAVLSRNVDHFSRGGVVVIPTVCGCSKRHGMAIVQLLCCSARASSDSLRRRGSVRWINVRPSLAARRHPMGMVIRIAEYDAGSITCTSRSAAEPPSHTGIFT